MNLEVLTRDRIGGIVLCGGKSTRMGRPKMSLPFGHETMLARVVRIVGEVVAPVVVVAAPGQDLPPLPAGTLIARDDLDDKGPLAGLAAGLAALRGCCDAAYASSCDVPLLEPAFIRKIIDSLGKQELAIARQGEFVHPLAAVYRCTLEPRIRSMIAAGRLRSQLLPADCDSCYVDVADLRTVDPELNSLRNLNTLADYEDALGRAGLGGD